MRSRVNRLNGGQRTLQWDTFTDADGTVLNAHASDDGMPYRPRFGGTDATPPQIDSGRVHNLDDTTGRTWFKRWPRWRRNYASQCGVVLRSDNNGSVCGPNVRISALFGTQSFAGRYSTSAANTWQIAQVSPPQSINTTVQTVDITIDQEYAAKIEMRGSVLLFWVDGVLLIRQDKWAANVRWHAPGFAFANNATPTTGVHLANWMATR